MIIAIGAHGCVSGNFQLDEGDKGYAEYCWRNTITNNTQWRRVCIQGNGGQWAVNEATTACQQLGYDNGDHEYNNYILSCN